jgi:hypothetical protein
MPAIAHKPQSILHAKLQPSEGDLTVIASALRRISIDKGWSISPDSETQWVYLPDDRKKRWLDRVQATIDIINSLL